jgi:mRNA interferase RelE/StbE
VSSASSRYEVELSEVAKRDLSKLESQAQDRLRLAFRVLSRNPRPPKSVKLKGRSGYRIRVGDYRVIYEIFDDKVIILVTRIGHRREIYKRS